MAATNANSARREEDQSIARNPLCKKSLVLQGGKDDCGPAALCTLLGLLGIRYSKNWVYGLLPRNGRGVTMLALKKAARKLGVLMIGRRLDPLGLRGVQMTPLIAAVERRHFVVITRIDQWGWLEAADPAIGLIRLPLDRFAQVWQGECLVVAKTDTLSGP